MPTSDNFTGTSGQLLTARGWELGYGQDCFSVSATGAVSKSVTTLAVNTVWSASNDGATTQRIVCDITSNNVQPIVYASGGSSGAAEGYTLRYAGGQLRLARITAGAVLSASLATYTTANGVGAELRVSLNGSNQPVLEIWQNGSGPFASFTDSGASKLTGGRRGITSVQTAVSTSSLDNFVDNSVIPQNLSVDEAQSGFVWAGKRQSSALSYTVSYTTKPSGNLEARIVNASTGVALSGFDWATKVTNSLLAAGPSSAAITFVAVPIGGPYRVQVRDSAETGTPLNGVNDFYVGTVIWIWGQSQASRMTDVGYRNGSSPIGTAGSKSSVVRMAASDKTNDTPSILPVAGTALLGEGITQCANAVMAENSNEPVMYVDCTFQGTSIKIWVDDAVPNGGTRAAWTYLATPLKVAARGQADYVMWRHGTADVGAETNIGGTGQTYAYYMDLLQAKFQALLPTMDPLFIVLPHCRSLDITGTETRKMREMQATKALSGNKWLLGSYILDIVMDGATSPHQALGSTGFLREGTKWARTLINKIWNSSLPAKGPTATTVEFASGTSQIKIIHDASIANTGGYSVSVDNGFNYSTPNAPGFTAAVTGTNELTLSKTGGSSWSAGTVRLDFARGIPFQTDSSQADYITGEATDESTVNTNWLDPMVRGTDSFDSGRSWHATPIGGTGTPVALPVSISATVTGGNTTTSTVRFRQAV